MTQQLQNVPVFDFADYEKNPQAFAQAMGEAFHKYNLIRIKNHGVPKELLEAADEVSKAFFAQEQSVKDAYKRPEHKNQVGYVQGDEKQSGATKADDKEHFMIHRRHADVKEGEKTLRAQTPDVNEVLYFNDTMEALYQQFAALTQRVLKPLALSMGVDENYFAGKTERSDSPMRTIHYAPGGNAAPHLDASLLTFVRGKAGLFVLPPADDDRTAAAMPEELRAKAIPVIAEDDELILNGGRQLAILSNNYFKPCRHWVEADYDRHTIVYFSNPNPDFPLELLPAFKGQDHGLRNEYWMKDFEKKVGPDPWPVTTYDFVNWRIMQNYAEKLKEQPKPGL